MGKLGRILVVLVFAMSCFFLAFSFIAFNSRIAWKEKVAEVESKLTQQRNKNREIEAEVRRMEIDRASGRATRANALALLEATIATSELEIAATQQRLAELQTQKQSKGREVTGSIDELQQERQRVDAARTEVATIRTKRDKLFEEVLDLKNQILELEGVRQRLNPSEARMLSY